MKVDAGGSSQVGWAQPGASSDDSRPPRVRAARYRASIPLTTLLTLGATYLGGAACAPPQYVAREHASLQAPVTVGEGNTGKPSLEELEAREQTTSGAVDAPPANTALPPEVALAIAGESAGAGSANPTSASPNPPPPFEYRNTPDPELAPTDAYYELTLRYCERSVHLLGAKRVVLKRPTTLPRLMGRFAAELWIGHELLERARFEFPGLAADTLEVKEPPPIELGARADVVWKVKVADRVRATQAWIVDRATGERWILDWPPQESTPKPTADTPCPSFSR
jgi:hypothetical protein